MPGVDMLLNKILNLKEKVIPLEERYVDNKDMVASIQYSRDISDIRLPLDRIIHIFDEDSELCGIVIYTPAADKTPPQWILLTSIIAQRGAPVPAAAYFNELALKISGSGKVEKLTVSREKLDESLIEYYSIELAQSSECKNCPALEGGYSRERIERLKKLITSLNIEDSLRNSIEICCGNGMSTLSLHELGYSPLTIDIDECQICEGLKNKALSPKRTIVMDAAILSVFYPPETFDSVLGFMLGTIYSFDSGMWIRVLEECIKVCKKGGVMVFTVNSHEEVNIIRGAMERQGVNGKVIDNRDESSLYDQWVYVGVR